MFAETQWIPSVPDQWSIFGVLWRSSTAQTVSKDNWRRTEQAVLSLVRHLPPLARLPRDPDHLQESLKPQG